MRHRLTAAFLLAVTAAGALAAGQEWLRFTTGSEYDDAIEWQTHLAEQGLHYEGSVVLRWRTVEPEASGATAGGQTKIVQCEDYSGEQLTDKNGNAVRVELETPVPMQTLSTYVLQWVKAVGGWRVGASYRGEPC
ncbi:MAG: hypothetical protein LBH76_09615 [Propionibacteriaceae bacterium]|jgi:hypothetical protein|nr:hypothetical protein [Propionibacteriaceae bacterium]